jgi:hypothetical protein
MVFGALCAYGFLRFVGATFVLSASFFFLFNKYVNSGALTPRRSTARREGRKISFVQSSILGVFILCLVHVFVVYISLRDDRR